MKQIKLTSLTNDKQLNKYQTTKKKKNTHTLTQTKKNVKEINR